MTGRLYDAGAVCQRWWRSLQKTHENDKRNRQADPAALAHLRRDADVVTAASEPQTVRLYRELAATLGWSGFDETRLAAVAATAHVLAHVREDTKGRQTTAYLLGGKEPAFSSMRFQQLTLARTPEDVMRAFRSAATILNAKAAVADLATGILAWSGAFGDEARDSVRLKWIYDYHHQGQARPGTDDESGAETPAASA